MKEKKRHMSVRLEAHEVPMVKQDASDMGMRQSAFLALLWRNWRVKRDGLDLIPPLPKNP